MNFKVSIHDISNLNLDEIVNESVLYCHLFQKQPITSEFGKTQLLLMNNLFPQILFLKV